MTAAVVTPSLKPSGVPRPVANDLHMGLSNSVDRTAAVPATSNGTESKLSNGVHDDAYTLRQEYAYTPRKIKVFTIGAGFSGLLMAHKFQHRFPEMQDIVEHTIFEARSDVGGTWLANHYPGVQCDVPAHIYVSLNIPLFPSPPFLRTANIAVGLPL